MNLLLLLATLLLFTLALPASAQPSPPPLPPGGTDLLAGQSFTTFVHAGTGTVTPNPDGSFSAKVTQPAPRVWDIGFAAPTSAPIEKGDVLAFEFTATGKGALAPEAFLNAVVELNRAPHSKSLDITVSAGANPRRYVFPFTSIDSYPPGSAQLSIRFADAAQELQISNIRLVNYGKSLKLSDLPHTTLAYPGMEDNAPWRKEALARIEQIRKAPLSITVLDASGNPVPKATVKVEMTRHLFRFGTAVPAARLLEDSPDNLKFREILKSHFNYATLENDLKWSVYQNNPDRAARGVQWLRDNNFEVRGHNLIWPGWENDHNFPKNIVDEYRKRKSQDPAAAKAWLRQACADRVLSATQTFAGKIRDWDVVNETYSNHDVQDELGREVLIEWFKLARQGDPTATLYLNDYGILEGAGRDQKHIDFFFDELKTLKQAGAPLGGVGIQGHWGSTMTDPVVMLKILDRFATLGLPIQITEFDINISDEQTQALFTRDALITLFSHPATDAFILWGFWENSHWLPKGAMFRADWSPKPNAKVWQDWVLNKWWTRESLTTSPTGTASTRAFLGDYLITVTANGKSQSQPLTLPKPGTSLTLRLPQ